MGRFLHRILGPDRDIEDLVQQAFAEMLTSIDTYRGEAGFTTWMYGIASHVAHRHIGLEVRWRHRREEWAEWLASGGSDGPDTQATSEARETLRRLGEALASLGLRERETWVLRVWEGLSTEEVAVALNIPPGTVMSRLFRARKAILEALPDDCRTAGLETLSPLRTDEVS